MMSTITRAWSCSRAYIWQVMRYWFWRPSWPRSSIGSSGRPCASADADFQVVNPTPADCRRAAALAATYSDLPLGTTDATAVALAERLSPPRSSRSTDGVSVIGPGRVRAFTLLP